MEEKINASDAYLEKVNYHALAEWMAAEVLIASPEDPVMFLRDLLSRKVDERDGDPFNPADCTRYKAETYTSASKAGSAEGLGGDSEPTPSEADATAKSTEAELRARISRLETALESTRVMATDSIVSECCNLLNADRASLFLLDEARNELMLSVADGTSIIRVPVGKGISGTVAATGEVVNIPDAYEDSRFDRSADESTGYRTRSILAAPVRNAAGKTVAVLQALNRAGGPFNDEDEQLLGIFTAQAGIALQNALLYRRSERASARVRSVLELVRNLQKDLNVNSLMFTITQRAHSLVDADRCTLFLVDHQSHELTSLQGEVNIRIPIDQGIAGAVATSGELLNVKDAYADERFNQRFDQETGYRTSSILCMPIKGADGQVLAVIQLINKMEGGLVTTFEQDDEEIMGFFLSLAGPILQNSQVFARAQDRGEEDGDEFSGKAVAPRSTAKAAAPKAEVIEEEEDEEEEENEQEEDRHGKGAEEEK